MLILFIVLIAAPVIVYNQGFLLEPLKTSLWGSLGVGVDGIMGGLLQPLDTGKNDTQTYYTGSDLPHGFSSHAVPTPTAGNDKWHRLLI